MTTTTSHWGRRAAVATAAAAFALVPAAAHAATFTTLQYDASGTSYIAKTKSTLQLPATKLTTKLDIDTFDFTGTLPLKPTKADFKVLGFVPVSATVSFVPVGQVKGNIALDEAIASVKSTASYTIKLTDVKVAGIGANVGAKCQTVAPAVINADTRPGEGFDLEKGGTLVGTYTLGKFANCGLTTEIINALIPGPGNTVTINVSNGVEVPTV